jgi:hypothetical protein
MTRKTSFFISTVLTFASIIGLTGCTNIMLGLYGMKNIKSVDEKTILRYSKKYDIPITDNYELDTTYFTFLLPNGFPPNSCLSPQIMNHCQPLQVLYFNDTGQLESFHINCYAGGFPNLNWERNEIMSNFPPAQQTPLDSVLTLEQQLKFLRKLPLTKDSDMNQYDYIVVVYWNRFMGRQSKRLIHVVQNNSKLTKDKKVKIIYANNDNFYNDTGINGSR